MSRAFVSEGDGWLHCTRLGDSCMFAKEDGNCALPECNREDELPPSARTPHVANPKTQK